MRCPPARPCRLITATPKSTTVLADVAPFVGCLSPEQPSRKSGMPQYFLKPGKLRQKSGIQNQNAFIEDIVVESDCNISIWSVVSSEISSSRPKGQRTLFRISTRAIEFQRSTRFYCAARTAALITTIALEDRRAFLHPLMSSGNQPPVEVCIRRTVAASGPLQ